MSSIEQKIRQFFAVLDIEIDGSRPQDITIHDPRTFQRIFYRQNLGMGEAYMDGWWDANKMDDFFTVINRVPEIEAVVEQQFRWSKLSRYAQHTLSMLLNLQNKVRSLQVAKQHYNLGNSLYQHMLGPSMAYTCGYWQQAQTLDEAQYAKYKLVCDKLALKAGERVLELGCGFGGFARYAAEHYGVSVTAVNISEAQINYAKATAPELDVQYFLCDYRDHSIYNPTAKPFDKIVSIGLCEHVGYKNYAALFALAKQQIKDEGLFLLHTIGANFSHTYADPWIKKYIFPAGQLPSIHQLSGAMEHQFIIEDLHNFGADYDKTLMAWAQNFKSHWPDLSSEYDERFYRMWLYYLLSCAGAFRARSMQLWQIVLSPFGELGGYTTIR